jgi:hypothetical protein
MSKNYILGGGIAGLLAAYYLPDFYLVSDKLGGQSGEDVSLGPRLIKFDDYTKTLMRDLGVYPFVKKIFIGYLMDQRAYKDMPEGFREKYVKQTREVDVVEDSHLSSGQNTIDVFDVEYKLIVDKLIEFIKLKDKFVEAKVERVDIEKKDLVAKRGDTELWLKYDKLINTLPLPLFYKLSNQQDKIVDFDALDTSFIQVLSTNPMDLKLAEHFDYIYVVGQLFHRYTYLEKKSYKVTYILEYKGTVTEDNINLLNEHIMNGGAQIIDYKVIPKCQIKQSKNILEDSGVQMLGRYAQWNHGIKINELLKEIKERLLVNG